MWSANLDRLDLADSVRRAVVMFINDPVFQHWKVVLKGCACMEGIRDLGLTYRWVLLVGFLRTPIHHSTK